MSMSTNKGKHRTAEVLDGPRLTPNPHSSRQRSVRFSSGGDVSPGSMEMRMMGDTGMVAVNPNLQAPGLPAGQNRGLVIDTSRGTLTTNDSIIHQENGLNSSAAATPVPPTALLAPSTANHPDGHKRSAPRSAPVPSGTTRLRAAGEFRQPNNANRGFLGGQGLGSRGTKHANRGTVDMLDENPLTKGLTSENKHRVRWVIFALCILGYFGAALAFYHSHLGWDALDAIYFAVVVLTTVGYGDNAAIDTDGAMVFTGFFVLYGVGIISIVITAAIQEIVRLKEEGDQKRKNEKMANLVKDYDDIDRETEEADKAEEARQAAVWARYTTLIKAVLVIGVYAAGILMMMYHEVDEDGAHYSFPQAFYFVCVTATTVGFGDLSFGTEEGKYFALFWLVIVTFITASLFSAVGNALLGTDQVDDILDDELDHAFFKELDEDGDGDGKVTVTEWTQFVLVKCGYVDKQIIQEIVGRFHQLDADGSGHLTTDDILGPIEAAKDRAVSAASGNHRTPHHDRGAGPKRTRKTGKVGPATWVPQ